MYVDNINIKQAELNDERFFGVQKMHGVCGTTELLLSHKMFNLESVHQKEQEKRLSYGLNIRANTNLGQQLLKKLQSLITYWQ